MAKKWFESFANTKTRILVLFVGLLLLIGIVILTFSLGKANPLKTEESRASKIPQITAIPGGLTSEKYQTLQEEDNRRRAELAKKTGGSAVATIIGTQNQDNLSKKEMFGIEGELLKASDCKCPPSAPVAANGVLDPALAAQLINEIEAHPENALKLMKEHPGLAKALCTQKPELALKIMENNKEAAKLILTECPVLAKELAEKNPALFKQLMLENPDLAKKIADTYPEVLSRLAASDPEFARQLAKTNPEVMKTLMKGDPDFARKMAAQNPDMVKELMRGDPAFSAIMAQQNPDMVKKLMLDDPEFAKAMARNNPDMVNALLANDPNFKKALLEKNPGLAALLQIGQKNAPPVEEAPRKQAETQALRTRSVQLNETQQKQLAAILVNMEAQSKTAFDSWNTVSLQAFVAGNPSDKNTAAAGGTVGAEGSAAGTTPKGGKQIIVKAGTILFAVLDTAINTDEPGPIMATVISGRFKGAKILGDIQLATVVGANRPEKVVLNFNALSSDDYPQSLTIKAVAIDPDTARTALASNLDTHLLLRYGTLFASSLLTGYSKAITSQGSVQTNTSGNTTTTTTPNLNSTKTILAAFGDVGKKFGEATATYFNTPNTIKVNAGTGFGLLILSDVTNNAQ